MTTVPKTKFFDCLAYKRAVQEQIYEEIKHMTREQEIQYFRRRAEQGSLGSWWRKVKEQGKARPD